MATDIERLVVRLEADINKFTKAMDKAQGETTRATKKIEDDFGRLNSSLKSQLDGLGSIASAGVSKINVALGAIGLGLSLKGFQDAADEYKRIMNILRAGGTSEQDLGSTFQQLFDIAQRNSAPIEGLAQLFGRVSGAQKELGVSSQQIIGLTERVGQALRINGTSATEASGALLQLSQALSGGTVQAEEYNSLLDGLRPLLGAAAAGITEAGGSVAKLTALVKEGKVSSAAFFAGIEAGAGVLDQQLARAQDTVAQATTRMKNEFTVAVAEFDKLTGASASAASGMNNLSGSFQTAARAAAVAYNDVVALSNALAGFLGRLAEARRQASGGTSLNQLGSSVEFGLETPDQAGNRTFDPVANSAEDARKQVDALREAEARRAEAARENERGRAFSGNRNAVFSEAQGPAAPPPKTISVNDPRFAVKNKDKEGGGGGGGADSAKEQSKFDRELANFEKRRRALENEALTIGQGTLAVEKSKAAFELERAAKESGIPVPDALKTKINEAAEAYAQAKLRVEEITKAQQQFNELQQFIGTNLSSFFSDIISGGENASKALMNLAKRLADAALQAALLGQGPLASILGLGPTGGSKVGGLIGLLFSGFSGGASTPAFNPMGRATGGPVRAGQPYTVGENGRELFVPGQGGRIISAAGTRALGQGSGAAPLYLTINAPNSTPDSVEILKRQLPGIVMKTVAEAQRRGAN